MSLSYNLPGGYSGPCGKAWMCHRLAEVNPASVLDVGAGAGTYGRMARFLLPGVHLSAVEVWEPYAEAYRLTEVYDTVFGDDARTADLGEADVVIFGDVLDRMGTEDAAVLWARARRCARVAVLASVAVDGHTLARADGNPFERRAVYWTQELAAELLTGVVSCAVDGGTGVYMAGGFGRAGRALALSLGGVLR